MPGRDSGRQRPRSANPTTKHQQRRDAGAPPARQQRTAQDAVADSLESRARRDFSPQAFQQHASMLGDARLMESPNTGPRQALTQGLQRTYGNSYVRRLVDHVTAAQPGSFQPKLTVGAAGDRHEVEADAVAKQVVNKLSATESVQRIGPEEEEALQGKRVQRQALEEEEPLQGKRVQRASLEEEEPLQGKRIQRASLEEEEPLQGKRIQRASLEEEEPLQGKRIQRANDPASMDGGDVDPAFESTVQAAHGKGNPLPHDVRSEMEGAFGQDFSRVRVHTDGQASTLNRQVQALAFTTGSDIFFREGQYAPGSAAGKEVLAHELTHVVQQGGSAPKPKASAAARKRDPRR